MKKAAIFIFMIVIIVVSIPLGLRLSKTIAKHTIYEMYSTSIVMAEDVIIDNQHVINEYGKAIILTQGMRGSVYKPIDYYSDQNGYENITADFKIDDTRIITVLIAIDNSNEVWNYPTIGIDKIESSHIFVSEYKQLRDRYHSRVQNAQTIGVVISVVISLFLCGIVWLVYKNNEKAQS